MSERLFFIELNIVLHDFEGFESTHHPGERAKFPEPSSLPPYPCGGTGRAFESVLRGAEQTALLFELLRDLPRRDAEEMVKLAAPFAPDQHMNVVALDRYLLNPHKESLCVPIYDSMDVLKVLVSSERPSSQSFPMNFEYEMVRIPGG